MDPIARRQRADRKLNQPTLHEAATDLAKELRAERDRLLTPLVAWLSRRLQRFDRKD